MPEIAFNPERHRPPAPRRGRKRRAYELTADQISRYRLSPPPMGEFIWRRTNEVQLDPLLEAVSGIVEHGWVYYHRNGKQFLRPRVVPANPRTVYQVDQRERLTLAQREWKRLSATEREGWGRYAQEFWPERRGAETLARSGQNLFCGAQIQRMAWGETMSHAVPVTAKPAFAYSLEEVVSPDGTFSFRLHHGQANPAGYKLLLEMTPACGKITQKPLERMLTRAGQTDAGSFFDLAESGATYVLEQPRHVIRPGQRFGVRVTLLTPEGVRGKSRRFTLLRKDPLPQERVFFQASTVEGSPGVWAGCPGCGTAGSSGGGVQNSIEEAPCTSTGILPVHEDSTCRATCLLANVASGNEAKLQRAPDT